MDAAEITQTIRLRAAELGFALCGVCPAVAPPGIDRFDDWLASGFAGEMHYLSDRRDAYDHPRHLLDGVRSIVMLAMNYRTSDPAPPHSGDGRISRYAWGSADYHDLIRARLHTLADELRELVPAARFRGVVDTAPFHEREFAQLAGLGWIGKNTLLLNRQQGSYFFLAALLTDCELISDRPHVANHCGTCRACLDACPTNAFPRPYVLDASRCISYLTIELRHAIPPELRPSLGDWIFGCDVCQEVCPWNRRAPYSAEPAFAPLADQNPMELAALFDLDDAAFRVRFRNSPLWRPKRRGILRNAAIVLGNQLHQDVLPALSKGLNDCEPLVRGACAWALGRFRTPTADKALRGRLEIETDASVRDEINAAIRATIDPAPLG